MEVCNQKQLRGSESGVRNMSLVGINSIVILSRIHNQVSINLIYNSDNGLLFLLILEILI